MQGNLHLVLFGDEHPMIQQSLPENITINHPNCLLHIPSKNKHTHFCHLSLYNWCLSNKFHHPPLPSSLSLSLSFCLCLSPPLCLFLTLSNSTYPNAVSSHARNRKRFLLHNCIVRVFQMHFTSQKLSPFLVKMTFQVCILL